MQQRKLARAALIAAINVWAFNAYAVSPGFYLGLMAGPATNSAGIQEAQIDESLATTPVSVRSQQFGTRVYMGYKWNAWAAVEGGFTYYSNVRFEQKDPSVETCGGLSASVKNADIVGKLSWTMSSFEIFGKAGAAFVYDSSSGALNPGTAAINPVTGVIECGETQHNTQYTPVYGLGASYDLSQSVAVDVSWTRMNGGSVTGNIDFYALGLSYHFVNIYCGQFLC